MTPRRTLFQEMAAALEDIWRETALGARGCYRKDAARRAHEISYRALCKLRKRRRKPASELTQDLFDCGRQADDV